MEPEKAVKAFKKGKIVIFPTDTVWGIGCDLRNKEAIKRLYKIKVRPKSKPMAVLIASWRQAKKLAVFSQQAERLAKKFWPGKLTLVLSARELVPREILGKDKTVGLRIPNHEWLMRVLEKLPLGILATSANFSGDQAPLKKTMLEKDLISQADLVVDKVRAGGSSASSVIDARTSSFKVLRSGSILSRDFPLTIKGLLL